MQCWRKASALKVSGFGILWFASDWAAESFTDFSLAWICWASSEEALKSDDKAKMKTALQRTDAHIAQMRSHMSTCMDMMNMMGGMMGGGMMGNGKSEMTARFDIRAARS